MKNNKMTLLNVLNVIAITFYVAAIPGYYFFDYRIMEGIFGSCGFSLFFVFTTIFVLWSFAAVNNSTGDIYYSCAKQDMRLEICYTF